MEILTEYNEETLTKVIHDNWNSAMYKFFGNNNPRTSYKKTSELTILDSNIKISMFNRIFYSNLKPENIEQKISEIIQHFDTRKLPFTWQVDPDDKPDNLSSKLEEAGLQRSETPGMAVMLEDLIVPVTPDDFMWKKVETVEELSKWSYLGCKAYGMPEFGWEFMAGSIVDMGVIDDFLCYTGFYKDKPVATSAVFYSEGVAGLYNIANLPEMRGKRIGSMISYVPFIDAVERGYKIGILHSTQMGYNMYNRLGFEEICKLVSYQWNPTE